MHLHFTYIGYEFICFALGQIIDYLIAGFLNVAVKIEQDFITVCSHLFLVVDNFYIEELTKFLHAKNTNQIFFRV
jgi:hypothetical protein